MEIAIWGTEFFIHLLSIRHQVIEELDWESNKLRMFPEVRLQCAGTQLYNLIY